MMMRLFFILFEKPDPKLGWAFIETLERKVKKHHLKPNKLCPQDCLPTKPTSLDLSLHI